MSRPYSRALAVSALTLTAALLAVLGSASAQTESTDPGVETKVRVPEPDGPGVLNISSRGNGPITIRQNGETRVYDPSTGSSVIRSRTSTAKRERQETPRDSRWRALLKLLESGEVVIHPRLSPEEMPEPPRPRERSASTRATSTSGSGSGSITFSRSSSGR